jgi:nitroreductase
MELYDVMRSTFAAAPRSAGRTTPGQDPRRHAFAPGGGNRQGWHIIVVKEQATKEALATLAEPAVRRYVAQQRVGESPWNAIEPTRVDQPAIEQTAAPRRLLDPFIKAPVVLVVCVDLRLVASTDRLLDRVGVIAGLRSPLRWNILLAARQEGLGGTITTFAVAQEPKLQELLAIPSHVAVAAIVPLGVPAQRLRRLSRKPVREFAVRERWGGEALG